MRRKLKPGVCIFLLGDPTVVLLELVDHAFFFKPILFLQLYSILPPSSLHIYIKTNIKPNIKNYPYRIGTTTSHWASKDSLCTVRIWYICGLMKYFTITFKSVSLNAKSWGQLQLYNMDLQYVGCNAEKFLFTCVKGALHV